MLTSTDTAQSPGAVMQKTSSRQQTSLREKESVNSSTQHSADGATHWNFKEKGRHPKKASSSNQYVSQRKFKSVGTAARVQYKREASRIRRAIEADRSANDIAKQVTMTRERESQENTRREVAFESNQEFPSEKKEDR